MDARVQYECTLKPEFLEKAITELNEPCGDAERLEAIDNLRRLYRMMKENMDN